MTTKARPWLWERWQKILAWERQNGISRCVDREATQEADNFRHELGHALATPEIARQWRKLYTEHEQFWRERNGSHYAAHGRNRPVEGLAETFAMVSRISCFAKCWAKDVNHGRAIDS